MLVSLVLILYVDCNAKAYSIVMPQLKTKTKRKNENYTFFNNCPSFMHVITTQLLYIGAVNLLQALK